MGALVRVLERKIMDGRTLEIRQLCAQGELFDVVAEEGGMAADASTVLKAFKWLTHMAGAIEHCHGHGIAHGQLRPVSSARLRPSKTSSGAPTGRSE